MSREIIRLFTFGLFIYVLYVFLLLSLLLLLLYYYRFGVMTMEPIQIL